MELGEFYRLIEYMWKNNEDDSPVYIRLEEREFDISEVSVRKSGDKTIIFIGD